MADTETLLEGDGVTKTFGGFTAVDDVDFDIQRGEIVGLIGPNGAGKSTLFNCITSTLEPDDGRIRFRGTDITERAEHEIAQSGLVRLFQEVRVYDDMTLYENLLVSRDHSTESTADMFRRYDSETSEHAESLLREVDLWEMRNEPAGSLSYGQQKLVEFAMTLMADPALLLLDEPTGGINPTMIEHMIEYINDANEERDKTLFVIEHNMDVIMEISDRIYVMGNGDVIAEGEPDEVKQSERVREAYLGGQ